jgi:hypothetical protein
VPSEERYGRAIDLAPGRIIRAIEEPIRVGSILWVYIDPHKGQEQAFNRWYERDHYYAGCMIGSYQFAGSRWVAPKRLKDLRYPAGDEIGFNTADGSYACVYYILDGHHQDWLEWSTPQALWLYSEDRGFNSRTHYNTGTFGYEWRAYRDSDPVPLELALDHHYQGLVSLFVQRNDDVSQDQIDAWFDSYLPGWLAGSPVAIVSQWANIPLLATKSSFVPDEHPAMARRRLQLHFLETDPADAWEQYRALGAALEASGLGHIILAAPFLPTVVGTDAHANELW